MQTENKSAQKLSISSLLCGLSNYLYQQKRKEWVEEVNGAETPISMPSKAAFRQRSAIASEKQAQCTQRTGKRPTCAGRTNATDREAAGVIRISGQLSHPTFVYSFQRLCQNGTTAHLERLRGLSGWHPLYSEMLRTVQAAKGDHWAGLLRRQGKTRHTLFAVQRLGPIVQLGEAQIRCHEFEKTGQLVVEGEVFPFHFYTSLAPIRQKPGPRLMHEPGFSIGWLL